jgi:hypothetical protein
MPKYLRVHSVSKKYCDISSSFPHAFLFYDARSEVVSDVMSMFFSSRICIVTSVTSYPFSKRLMERLGLKQINTFPEMNDNVEGL